MQYSDYIVYVDESGDHSLESINPEYPVFVLAFCIFHKNHYSEKVVSALQKFKFKHFGHNVVVLHEHEIRKEKVPFNIFKSRNQKHQFLGEMTEIIEQHNFVLMTCVIEKQRLKSFTDSENPYHIALNLCLEGLYGFLHEKDQNEFMTHIVVERRGKKEDNELELEFRRICDGHNRLGRSLPFEIQFAHKQVNSAGLQLADLVARPVGLHVLRPEQPNRAFESLKAKFYCKGGRCEVGKDFEEYGLKRYP